MGFARRLVTLSRTEWALLLRACFWIVAARLGLRFSRLPRLGGAFAGDAIPAPPVLSPTQVAWAVHAAARRLPGTRCLARSLALHALLRRGGHASELKLGVARGEGRELLAHAWIECPGLAFAAEGAGAHAPLASLSSSR